MAGLVERLARLLGRRRCLRVTDAAALLRATPGEVLEAASMLGAVVENGVVCAARAPGPRRSPRPRVVVLGGGCCVAVVEPREGGLPRLVSAARRAAAAARRVAEEGCPRGCRAVAPVVAWRGGGRASVEGVLVSEPGGLGPWVCGVSQRLYRCRRWQRGWGEEAAP